MGNKFVHIMIAYLFNIIYIIMGFAMMRHYSDGLLVAFLIGGSIYLIYWVVVSRKSYMPRSVYLNFLAGVLVNLILNYFGIIPQDVGFFTGLGQLFYMFFLFGHAVLVGLANLILYIISRVKKRKS